MDYAIVFFLVLLSACFSGLTLGFFSLNLTSLERKMKLGDKRAKKVYPIRKNGNLLLCTLLLGNVAVNSAMAIFLGNIATGLVAGLVSTSLIVVFGEIIPQAIFSRFALTLGANSVWLVRTFIFLLYPVAYPLSWALNKGLGEELGTIWSKKEIEEIIKHHEDSEESEIDADEERIMLGALAFSNMTAEMVATPRPVVFMLEKERQIDKSMVEHIKEKGFSRIPIYSNGNKDMVEGILFSKDLLGFDFSTPKTVADYLRPDFLSVRDDMPLDKLLNHFIGTKRHMAYVFDEFGVFYGVVTLEDVLEEILKVEIVDESDRSKDMRATAIMINKREMLE
ncbi:MAG: metal transporter CNNM [Saprospiraceae bacterium]|jgi:metal transporter CNNM